MFENSYELFLRFATLIIFILWALYWLVTERSADREKPKTKYLPLFHKDRIRKFILRIVEGLLALQLLGLPLFQASNFSFSVQVVGFLLVVLGFAIAFSARKTLGTNWAHAFEYQVKQKQELVTSGIYGYIRHPIYTGIILGFIGGELVAKSYLVFIGIFIITAVYHQALLEEKLLVKHFGDSYKKYLKRSKMLIPFLW